MDIKVGKKLVDWSIGQVMQAVNIGFIQSLLINTSRLVVITLGLTHVLSHEGMFIPMHALSLYANVTEKDRCLYQAEQWVTLTHSSKYRY